MKIREMIGKIYKACLTKGALAALEAKTLQAEEQERLEFIENNKQKLVQLSPLAQTILNTLVARLETGEVLVSKRYSPYRRWEITVNDWQAEQLFEGYIRSSELGQGARLLAVHRYYLESPVAFPQEEGNTLFALFMEHYHKEQPRLDAMAMTKKQKAEWEALAKKYVDNPVTKE